ncbi:pyridoxamine 5'-phosphate oxidase family protein [Erythrobacter sp.]|jgi:3-hydroxyisobutyrate dehydrogenase|uniref:pyridoxamine 5'-phosphate oxidase family protein n=1 Tax=Erythrobacter sp. TaxID=1042 RepID=UPI002EC0577B|nr:pyridoxamine 5'-phosphate oxidase family protein [Erythrobacter sp.]
MIETLEEVRQDVARRMARAAKDRRSPMHVPVVVTGDIDARVMVLRAFDSDPDSSAWYLRFHTDTRAPKVAAIAADPRMAVLFYDKGAKIQIRMRGTGEILREDPAVEAAWNNGSNFARRCYLGDGPGTRSDAPTSGLPAEFEGTEPSDAELETARANFALLRIEVTSFDWLYLAHTGHWRAQFERGEDATWQGHWATP